MALAAAVLAGGAAIATFAAGRYGDGRAWPHGPGKLFAQFDLNHDGKITKAEMEKVLAQKFASASGGKSTMTEAQFAAMRVDMVKPKIETLFHRVNWSGSGKLSRDEYLAAERLRFERADRDGTGVVKCPAHPMPMPRRLTTQKMPVNPPLTVIPNFAVRAVWASVLNMTRISMARSRARNSMQ